MYRYDIQGLRAISVFLVIFYHLKIPFFEGGYIGVDLFFIISGYIITKKIHDKLKSKNFNLLNFLIERLRKIAPPLITTIFFTIFLSYFFLLPEDFSNLSKSIFSNFLFLSNIYFNYFTTSGYFATDAISKPLLHTWSISVEVQFYIFVSISLLIISKFFKNKFLYFFLIVFLISLIISTFIYLKGMMGTNFYQLPFRLFEFSLGSICVYLKKNKNNNLYNNESFKYTEFLGVFIIILSLIVFKNKLIPHPSVLTLLPLLGVFLILFFNDKKKNIKTSFLSNKILVYFGTISYSLFLVHYPLVSIANFLYIFNYTETKFLIVLISIFLSILLYHNIEKKFTKRKLINNKIFFLSLIFSLILISSSCYLMTKKDLNNSRFAEIFTQKLRHIEDDRDYALKHLKKINNKNNKKIFLIGDSHAGTLKYNILMSSNFLKYNVFSFTNLGLYIDGFEQYNRYNYSLNSDYTENNDQIKNFLINNKNLIVIISQRWSVYTNETFFDNEEGYKDYNDEKDKYYPELYVPKNIDVKKTNFQQRQKYILKGIEKTILDILNLGHKVVLVYPIPDLGFDAPKIILKKYLIKRTIPILSTNYNVYKKRNYLIIKLFNSIDHKNLYKVFPDKFFCDTKFKDRCLANTNDNMFYYDKTHLSLYGSKFITDEIVNIIKKIND